MRSKLSKYSKTKIITTIIAWQVFALGAMMIGASLVVPDAESSTTVAAVETNVDKPIDEHDHSECAPQSGPAAAASLKFIDFSISAPLR